MFTLPLKKQVQDLLLFDICQKYTSVESAGNFNEYWIPCFFVMPSLLRESTSVHGRQEKAFFYDTKPLP